MMLDTDDKQMAMDYTIYMMMGSFFDRTQAASPSREKILRMRYLLLGQKKQVELEEMCERYFEEKILPGLPKEFLEGTALVSRVTSRENGSTAVVFTRGSRQLWVASLYGGRFRQPVFTHWTTGFQEKGRGNAIKAT